MSSVIDSPAPLPLPRQMLARWSAFIALLVLLLALYFESWRSMQQVWNIQTYTHGYVVPLISAWLAWRQREVLAGLQPATGWLALAGMACCGLLWLAGELAGVNAARHFAVMGMAVLLVPLVFGWQIARHLAFPLGFLFFAVPFGEFLLPWLMEATAAVTIWLVGLSGVPIYREGLSFILPSGSWEVVEECSGQRYLIATLPLACLYAWLSFERNRTRCLFVLFAVAVALLANWLRAWGIVMLGHLSGMTIATGVDHLVYGWLFFGIVMVILFWLGSRWTEAPLPDPDDAEPLAAAVPPAPAGASSTLSSATIATIAGALMLAIWVALSGYLQTRDSPQLELASVTREVPGFAGVDGTSSAQGQPAFAPGYEGAYQEIHLHSAQATVSAWIGAYEHQADGTEMIQHANSVKPRSMREWSIAEQRAFAPLGGSEVTEYVLAGHGAHVLVWRSYVVDGRMISSDAHAKLLTAWRVAQGRGDRSIALILWTPFDSSNRAQGQATARSRLQETLREIAPILAKADRGAP